MKKSDFENFKVSLDLTIEIDCSLRRITEKLKLIAQSRNNDLLCNVIDFLGDANDKLDSIITDNICSDEH